jgi:hypothetical protein
LARKIKGDAECGTVRISFMEIGAGIASKSTLVGNTSKSPSRIVCRTPSPDQDLTYVPPHLRPADPNAANIEVKNEPIIRKRYEEICYLDGRPPKIVNESVTAVIY